MWTKAFSKEPFHLGEETQRAAQGEPFALYRLGYLYENGLGVEMDWKQAAYYYRDYIEFDFELWEEERKEDSFEWESLYEDGEPDAYLSAAYTGLGRCLLQLRKEEYPWGVPSPKECFLQAIDLADTRDGEAEADYLVGKLYFFGIGIKVDMEVGLSYIQDGAERNYPPAVEFLTRKKAWDTVSEELLAAGHASEEERKKEALLRLTILEEKGVSDFVRVAFEEKGTPGYADEDCYGFETFQEGNVIHYEEIQKAVREREQRDCTVYFVHSSLTMSYGLQASIFYVSPHPAEWLQDREDLLRERPIVAVANISQDFTEIGEIGYSIEDDLMRRLY